MNVLSQINNLTNDILNLFTATSNLMELAETNKRIQAYQSIMEELVIQQRIDYFCFFQNVDKVLEEYRHLLCKFYN